MESLPILSNLIISIIVTAIIWEYVWKGFALWKAGRNNHLSWFLAIFILNTLGILPIIYLLFFQKKWDPTANDEIFDRTN